MRNPKHIILTLALSLFLVANVYSQTSAPWKTSIGTLGSQTRSSGSIFGIDLSKFDVSYGYSLSTTSLGGNTISMGILSSRIFYQANPNLSFSGEIGFVHNPLSSFSNEMTGINNFSMDNMIFKGKVTYRPTQNSFLTIAFERNPYNYYNYYSNFSNHYIPGFTY